MLCRIRHPKEKISKSSIVPSKIIAPDNVTIEHFMDAPLLRAPEEDYDSVVILFPSADAVDLAKMPDAELKKIKRVYLIDCTWN